MHLKGGYNSPVNMSDQQKKRMEIYVGHTKYEAYSHVDILSSFKAEFCFYLRNCEWLAKHALLEQINNKKLFFPLNSNYIKYHINFTCQVIREFLLAIKLTFNVINKRFPSKQKLLLFVVALGISALEFIVDNEFILRRIHYAKNETTVYCG